ncbi:MAG: HesA/MoeB/ThiF family protein [Anaerolineae bacterium]|nr:HesA/MoeB/ThiF family protein [Anaerolineae bacterium]
MPLTDRQRERYSRNITLRRLGEAGQEKLLASKVLVIGAGGLGSSAILYLAAAGIGTLGIADSDAVKLSNLQRQILYDTSDVGKSKIESAREKVVRLNSDVKVITYCEKLTAANIVAIIGEYDFVVECTDTFPAKFLINEICVQVRRPFSHGGVLAFRGQTMTYVPGHACLHCIFDPPPPGTAPTSEDAGILGAAAGIFGAIQAGEAIKYLAGTGKLLTDAVLYYDVLNAEFKKVKARRKAKCPVCGS